MNTCQFRIVAGGPACGQATLGEYCWFHQGIMDSVQAAGTQQGTKTAPTNTVGTSNTWATTNTTPELAVAQHSLAQARFASREPWYRRWQWWKILIAGLLIGGLIFLVIKFWFWILLLGGLLLLLGMLGMGRNMNVNQNRNANENVNQVTVNPTMSQTVNVGRDDD
jgi:hypothetical protein